MRLKKRRPEVRLCVYCGMRMGAIEFYATHDCKERKAAA